MIFAIIIRNRSKNMQKLIKENLSKYLSIFLILQPVLDMLTGICLHIFHLNITLGIIIRLLFLAFIGYITIFIYKKKTKKHIQTFAIFSISFAHFRQNQKDFKNNESTLTQALFLW